MALFQGLSERNNDGNFREVPHGEYEVSVEKLELKSSEKGDPMVSVWFKVVAGEYKGCHIFMNQVITYGFQIHLMNEFLRSMDTGLEIEFVQYSQYGQLLMDVAEAIDGKLEFAIAYGEKKGFNTFENIESMVVTEVFRQGN